MYACHLPDPKFEERKDDDDPQAVWACYSHGKYSACKWPLYTERELQWLHFIRWLFRKGKVTE